MADSINLSQCVMASSKCVCPLYAQRRYGNTVGLLLGGERVVVVTGNAHAQQVYWNTEHGCRMCWGRAKGFIENTSDLMGSYQLLVRVCTIEVLTCSTL